MGPLTKGALVTPTPPAHLVYSLLTTKTSTALTCAGSVGGGLETPAHGLTAEQRGTFGGDPYYVRYRPNLHLHLVVASNRLADAVRGGAQAVSCVFALTIAVLLIFTYLYCRAKGIGNIGPEREDHIDAKAASAPDGVSTYQPAGWADGHHKGGRTGHQEMAPLTQVKITIF